ncbi:MAG TPA: hypothetical protein PK413_13220 [Thermoanaerobaculia bacterium]|nr:hypothetical protein [Thermoanaerobaculia bacterium]
MHESVAARKSLPELTLGAVQQGQSLADFSFEARGLLCAASFLRLPSTAV